MMIHSTAHRIPLALGSAGGLDPSTERNDSGFDVSTFRRFDVSRPAFTIVELLVVTAIIILLLSILIVAVNAASKTAQRARTVALMDSIKKGLIRFKGDIGYYPPVLGPGSSPVDDLRRLFVPPVPGSAGYANVIQQWWSSCALADYLVGWDGHNHDGYGRVAGAAPLFDWDIETPPVGIRSPLEDGVWGATRTGALTGALADRMKMGAAPGNYGSESAHYPIDEGKVWGPYVELSDERLLAAISGYDGNNQPILHFAGDPVPAGMTFEALPKTIVDYWGMPIRYFRRPYPQGALGQSYRAGVFDFNGNGTTADDPVPTLSDVFVLRPWTIKPGTESLNQYGDQDPNIPGGNKVSTRDLDAAEFAILSTGPDKRLNQNIAVDPAEYNKDNIVEVGP